METTLSDGGVDTATTAPCFPPVEVVLADGTIQDLSGLDRGQLVELQWQQEQAFAERIQGAAKGSAERAEAVRDAYDTITKVFASARGPSHEPLTMGLHPRYERLLERLLQRQQKRRMQPRFLEIGYGSGVLLKRVSQWGFPAAGIEISTAMYEQACRLLGPDRRVELHLGDFLHHDFGEPEARYSLVYWNDVFEHIPPDEILDYLRKIHGLLVPGGQLVTITPNWHMRPWDVTRLVCPPRTEAAGLHLKEYTLREVTGLLREAGFAQVAVPLAVLRSRVLLWGGGLTWVKRLAEPCLEWLPHRAADLLCRGLGLSETVATKGRETASAGRTDPPRLSRQTSIRLPDRIAAVLRCPICRARLQPAGEEALCTNEECGKRFPSIHGAPILINEKQSLFSISGFLARDPTFFRPAGRLRRWLSARIPTLSHNLAARKVLRQMRGRLLQANERPAVLVVGGGEIGAGLKILLDDPAVEVIESDVSAGPRIQCICDGHDLPFDDGTFDGAVIQAVLEHVVDPARCVAEIHRVLKPGGIVYADTPFVCQVHGRQFDFTRWTRLGHRRLFRQFSELSSGISSGPGMAMGWTLRYFLLSFFTSPVLRAAASGFARLAFFWLKYLDYVLVRKPGALDAAFAFYFLGEKSGETLSDRDLIQSYRGGF